MIFVQDRTRMTCRWEYKQVSTMFAIRKTPSLETEWGERVGGDQKETDN